MHFRVISTIALAMLVAPGAQAQNQPTGAQAAADASVQQVKSSLEQAGFQRVRMLGEAYVVRAQTQNGEQIIMMVNPSTPLGGTAGRVGTQAAPTQQGVDQQNSTMSQQRVHTALTQAGFQNVEILDATHVAEALTQDSDVVVMMIDPLAAGSTDAAGSQ